MNIFTKEIHEDIFLFLLILYKSCGGALTKELHEAPLHDEPEHPGQVEDEGKDDEVERDPLVVRVVHNGGSVLIPIFVCNTTETKLDIINYQSKKY